MRYYLSWIDGTRKNKERTTMERSNMHWTLAARAEKMNPSFICEILKVTASALQINIGIAALADVFKGNLP